MKSRIRWTPANYCSEYGSMMDLNELTQALAVFAEEREWDQFHSPKNLAMALSVEASEIVEHFQWLTEEQSLSLTDAKREEVADEIGDVLIYLARLADRLGIDPLVAATDKLEKNRQKYPKEIVRGSARKYTEYD